MGKCNVMFVFVAETCKPMCISFVHLLIEHSVLKQYCTDHRTANAIQFP